MIPVILSKGSTVQGERGERDGGISAVGPVL